MRTRQLFIAAFTTVVLAICASPADAAAQGNLYLQQAGAGSLSGSKLVLRGVSPRVTTFTDRPQRRASSLSTRSFTSGFSRAFRGDPPNAALQIDGASARSDVALLELRRPRYDARKRTLTYTVRRLRTASRGLSRLGRRADRGVKGSFKRATLFIDDGGSSVFVSFVLTAPTAASASITLGGGAAFDLDFNSTLIPTPGGSNPNLSVRGTTMSVTPNGNSNTATSGMYVGTWLDTYGSVLTGTAIVPSGGFLSITPQGNGTTQLSSGQFAVPLD